MEMLVEVKTQFEGLHCWPEAPDEVGFLRNMHRHMFHVVLRIPVEHSDRDVEFIMAKHNLDKFVKEEYGCDGSIYNLGRTSCEEIARSVLDWAHREYGIKPWCGNVSVGVFEDNENGCWLEGR